VRGIKILVLTSFLLIALPGAVWAGGNPEVGLPKVDRLIKDRNYNGAIMELAAYIKEHPEDFDGAQARIRRIIKMRENYNSVADDLISVLVNDPTNDKKKLDMIAYLESLEKNPNASTSAFISDTKAAAQFTYYRAKFDEILTVGDSLIDQGQYLAAVNKFAEGYIFYKQEFDEANAPEAVAQVNQRLSAISGAILSYGSQQEALRLAAAECEQALASEDISRMESAFGSMSATLSSLSGLRNSVAEAGWFFEDSFSALQAEDATLTENSFLPFAQRFTLGRKTAGRFEGVLGAMDAQWSGIVARLDSSARDRMLAFRASGDPLSGASELSMQNSLASVRELSSIMDGFYRSLSVFSVRDGVWGLPDIEGLAKTFRDTGSFATSYGDLGSLYNAWIGIRSQTQGWSEEAPAPEGVRTRKTAFLTGADAFIAELGRLESRVTAVSSGTAGLVPFGGFAEPYNLLHGRLLEGLRSDTLAYWRKTGTYLFASSDLILSSWKDSYSRAVALLEGTSPNEGSARLFYPTESAAAFTALRNGAAADRRSLIAAVDKLSAAPANVRSDSEYVASIAGIGSVLDALDSLSAQAGEGIAKANTRILQANLARQEADLRYSQAVAALSQNNFQLARDNLQRSRDKYNQSLTWQESVTLRADSDKKLSKLGEDITRTENELVVREVRSLISSGKNFYYQGNIDQAEQVFNQAKTRWSATNVEPNAEVTNWLDIIKTALSMKTGRTIPVSDPLFPQMSQLLNGVNLEYSNGASLMKVGKTAEATMVLSDAKAKLQQLKLVYPLNQDAGLLTLMIDKLLDPPAFNANFRRKIETIRSNYKTAQQESYSDLLDLYAMNPSYPGIKNLLYEVEVYLGIRIPPPDPAAIKRSDQLTAQAKKIYDANARSQFDQALLQLDQAIKLNPENQGAIILKDRIATSIGGGAQVVLSGEDEAKYQQAVQELQKGNTINASALVEQLLLNPKNKNSAKVLDLKKKVDSLL